MSYTVSSIVKLHFLILLTLFCTSSCSLMKGKEYKNWDTYRGTPGAIQYSDLDLVDTANVHLLTPVWTYHTGDSTARSTIECNPIIIGDRIFLTSAASKLIALEASTGKELWTFNPIDRPSNSGVNRGVTYWKNEALEYIFFPAGKFLYAVNAIDGQLISTFGDGGKIDLRKDLGIDTATASVTLTTPGIIFEDLIIIGSATGEGYNASPGHIRAYKAMTGDLIWTFHTIPQKGEFGYETWNWMEGENYGGTNNWGGMSLDEKKGLVYISTGSPTYDFYGANRVGENLFGNCILALDAKTGIRKWHYQAVHHDIWDYDLPCAPTVADITWQGKSREVVIQPTKMGELILLDRNTGEALLQPVEKPVPASNVPGEKAFSSQPLSQGILLTKQGWDSTDLTTLSDTARQYILQQARQYQPGLMYNPPSLNGTIGRPGTRGGMLWGGISYDPRNNIVFANCNDFPMIYQLEKVAQSGGKDLAHDGITRGQIVYNLNCTNCHGSDRKGSTSAVPGLIGLRKKYTKQAVETIIRSGKGLMPAHTQFSSSDLNSMIDYLFDEKSNSPSNEKEPARIDSISTPDKYVLKSYKIFTDQEGYPASAPPWGTLNALDMNTGKILWQVALGEYPALKARGVPITGTQNFGGCVSTAGGLVFIGATADEMFRAYNATNGKELWNYKLPAGGYATPSVYQVAGKQFIVIAAGGGNRNGTKSSDAYMAFGLK